MTISGVGIARVESGFTRFSTRSSVEAHPRYDMDLRLLGPIEARLGDRIIALGAHKQRALLAMLALHANRAVSTDRLVEGLWGEEPPPSAPKMVQLYVSRLRRVLEGEGAAIVTHGRGYELRLSRDDIDVARFERLVDEGRPREALALWRGEALADVADHPFAEAEIRRLDELRLRAYELAIEAELATGRHNEVIGELEALVEQHPMSERLHGQRMLALYRAERQAEALAAYRQARAALVEEVGVEPGPELRRLHAAILAQDRALELPAAEPSARPPPARRLPLTHRRAGALLVAAALVALATLIGFGVTRVIAPDRLPRIEENAVGVIEPDDGRITGQYPVGANPAGIAGGAGSMWVANTLDGTVSRIDRDRDEVVTIPVGGTPAAVAFGAGSLWVADGDARNVAQLDPGRNTVVRRLTVGNSPRAVAVGYGALWVASGVDGSVRRIDLVGDAESRSIPVGANPTGVAAGAGAIWVASEEAGTVSRIEPRSGEVVRAIHVGNGPSAVAVGEGAVWALNRQDGTISRIDPATDAVSWTVGLGGEPLAVAAGGGAVWVAGGAAGTITRVDPRTPDVLERVEVGGSPAGITVADGEVWATVGAPPAAHRGGTLRVRYTSDPPNALPIDWLEPAGYTWSTAQLTSLAYDGLVGYRRVAGAAGATLVGALATSAPQPSRDGRTYVFTLRNGLRYSDGSPVRAGDFRASLERFLRVTRDRFPPFYGGIVGSERCVAQPVRCDLSAGIESDERTRTIAVHLTRPDAEFLHKLTSPFAYVVPANTPLRLTAGRAPPGTGPYRFAAWDANQGGHLVRNPHFRSASPESRPPGFADRIEVGVRRPVDIEAPVAEVRDGTADLAVLVEPFKSRFGRKRLSALAAQSPGQVHSRPVAATEYMFLNVRRSPFDDLRVRRALNYATDRERLVALEGGPEVAGPTCQIIPVGFPGYKPYCPYTAAPAPGRGWTSPDLSMARRLVARSATAGERVVVHVPEFKREVGSYFAALLDDLGYDASRRVVPDEDYFPKIYDPGTRAQMGFIGWSSDYATPSNFIQPNFTCASPAARRRENASYFCDRALARQVDRALGMAGAEAAAQWAAIDRRLTDLAPAVPLSNRRSVVLVSRRVGNVQHHVQSHTLLDRLWVR